MRIRTSQSQDVINILSQNLQRFAIVTAQAFPEVAKRLCAEGGVWPRPSAILVDTTRAFLLGPRLPGQQSGADDMPPPVFEGNFSK
jgi:hypothetical protein